MEYAPYSTIFKKGSFPGVATWNFAQAPVALFTGMAGSSDAVLIADLFSTSKRPLLVLVENSKRAETLCDECATLIGEEHIAHFPSRESVAYSLKSPFGPVVEERLRVLMQLQHGQRQIIIAPSTILQQRIMPPRDFFNSIIRLNRGQEVAPETLAKWLVENGFRRESAVGDLGTFAIRGSIVDIYPFLCEDPLRLEFWGDTIESIRSFDVFTQKSRSEMAQAELVPMREFRMSEAAVADACANITLHADPHSTNTAVQKLIHQWQSLGDLDGSEWFLHWFEAPAISLLDYLPAETVVVWDDMIPLWRRMDESTQNYEHHRLRLTEQMQPLVSAPDQLLINVENIEQKIAGFTRVFVDTLEHPAPQFTHACALREQPRATSALRTLRSELCALQQEGYALTLLCANDGHAQRMVELLAEPEATGPADQYQHLLESLAVYSGYLQNGYVDPATKMALLTDHILLGAPAKSSVRRKFKSSEAIANFDVLAPGDFVVHVDHGIARFVGIERVKAGEAAQDCMLLEYQDHARLYVPVDDFNKVQKYIGRESYAPVLSKLGTAYWERTKERTRQSLREMAAELIELYAKRQYLEGNAMPPDTLWQREFEDAFVYDATVDQVRAVAEVKADMEAKKPMDRLVCGDVGFGKTEVAMRAAFKAVMSGYQVAILAPTTILVAQHFATFSQRMADFPVRIGMVSRFLSSAEQKVNVEKTARGDIDILIGTHRLLSKDIAFKKLGLLIIDEEQRFGVKHKEKLKQYSSMVDVLSLSATPIPRTLHMSLVGARDLSMITTPPRNRLPIETKVTEYHDELLKKAIETELERGGQVYVVQNRISRLDALQDKIEQLVPRARVIAAHGQMEEHALELIMQGFVAGRYDVLLSTVIIENGLDIPNVNTIVVIRADAMGLSQLYQLRGRVGRSAEQAYAYFLTPSFKEISELSLRRLRALEQYTELGSGFQIAMRDLEIRGAGNLLGTSQHGFISAVGFELYCRLLQEAVQELKGEAPPPVKRVAVIEINAKAFIPTEYIPDGQARIAVYQDLSAVSSLAELASMRLDLIDRFGPLPGEVDLLLLMIQIKVVATELGCSRVTIGADRLLKLTFEDDTDRSAQSVRALAGDSGNQCEVFYEKPLCCRLMLGETVLVRQLGQTMAILQKTLKSL